MIWQCLHYSTFKRHSTLLITIYMYFSTAGRVIRVGGTVHNWGRSYQANRMQFVHFGASSSNLPMVSCVFPQGLVLGSIPFVLYTADVESYIVGSSKVTVCIHISMLMTHISTVSAHKKSLLSFTAVCQHALVMSHSGSNLKGYSLIPLNSNRLHGRHRI